MSTQGFVPIEAPVRMIALEVDGRPVKVREGQTILDACTTAAVETPTLCFATNLTPVNACRVCVVELEGARVLRVHDVACRTVDEMLQFVTQNL